MNDHDLKNLQALRQLREQRAGSQLAAQRTHCRESHAVLDAARERLHQHREAAAREAEKLYGRFSEGLSVSAWLAVQWRLGELEDDQQALLGGVEQAHAQWAHHEQARTALQVLHGQRQRQVEAWDYVLRQHAHGERRAGERREDSEDLFAPLADIKP